VAWTSMLAENLHKSSLCQAVEHTFDGRHACCLCKEIANGKQSEKKSDFHVELKRLEFPPIAENPSPLPPTHFYLLPRADSFAESLPQEPPVPPPRGIFA
jgi:hypothetical protein